LECRRSGISRPIESLGGKTRLCTTAIYRGLLLAVERRRQELGWSSEYLDDRAGTQDRYYQKRLHSESASGKVARWDTLQLLIDALWPGGIGVCLTRAANPILDDEAMRWRIKREARRYRKRDMAQRNIPTHLREYASAKEARP